MAKFIMRKKKKKEHTFQLCGHSTGWGFPGWTLASVFSKSEMGHWLPYSVLPGTGLSIHLHLPNPLPLAFHLSTVCYGAQVSSWRDGSFRKAFAVRYLVPVKNLGRACL